MDDPDSCDESAGTSSGSKGLQCKCAICGIQRSECPTRKFHKFPRNPDMSHRWAVASGKKWILAATASSRHIRYRVCQNHFNADQYTSAAMNRLKADAIPVADVFGAITVTNLQEGLRKAMGTSIPSPIEEPSSSPSTSPPSASPLSRALPASITPPTTALPASPPPTIAKYYKTTPKTRKIKSLSKRLYYMQRKQTKNISQSKALEVIKDLVSPLLYNFIKSQLKSAKVSKYGRRWSVIDKNLALQLYLASPKAYRSLSTFFYMPSKSTLLKCVSGIQMVAGFSEAILNAMKLVAPKLRPLDKYCIVSFDEMKLRAGLSYSVKKDAIEGFEDYGASYTLPKPHIATHALVFMVRGLCKKWKQVFGYFFSSESASATILKHLVNEALSKLQGCGLVPIAVVCDQGSSNQQLYKKELCVSPEKPYFFFQDRKIYCICDPPHLLKCLRNNFKRYPAVFTSKGLPKTAFWEHIVKLFEFDSQLTHRLVPKLTKRHVEVDGLSTMNVRMAAQIFSHSVSGCLCYMSVTGVLPPSASHTADFCALVNDLFDSVNGRIFKSVNPLLSAVSPSSPHLEAWAKSMVFLQSVHFRTEDVTRRKIFFPCLQGWLLTLSAFRKMIPELLVDIPFIFMSRFTQDALENFFSVVRRRGGNNDHPTPNDFHCRMRMLMAQQILTTFGSANCEPDEDTVLVNVQLLTDSKVHSEPLNLSAAEHESLCELNESLLSKDLEPIASTDIFDETFHLENSSAYIAGYIAKKVSERYQCNQCKTCLTGEKDLSSPGNLFLYFKEFDFVKKGLIAPSHSWLVTVCEFGRKFPSLYLSHCTSTNVSIHISECLCSLNHDWLDCGIHDNVWEYCVKFYVKLMLFYKVKYVSQSFLNAKRSRKKIKKLS